MNQNFNLSVKDYLFVAHRGYSSKYPENTMKSILEAYRTGVNAVEIDLRVSHDGVVIICHDETVDRTTNGKGQIKKMLWKDIQKLDASKGWISKNFKDEEVKIPSLEEVLKVIKGTGLMLELDIKDPAAVSPACKLIERYNMKKNCFFVASDHFKYPLMDMRQTYITYYEGTVYSSFSENLAETIKREADVVNIHGTHHITKDIVEESHQHSKLIRASWLSEDNALEAERLVDLNVNIILTDYPETLSSIARKKKIIQMSALCI